MLEGKYVKLRALEKSDLTKLRDWRNSKHIRKTVREFRILNLLNQKQWFEKIYTENPPSSIMFGIVTNSKLVGVCGLTYIDWKNKHAELSCYFQKTKWQKSKESIETIKLLLDYGFNELNLHRIWAEVYEISIENKKLLEKLGFVLEGTLRDKLWRDGRWWDSYVYSIINPDIERK